MPTVRWSPVIYSAGYVGDPVSYAFNDAWLYFACNIHAPTAIISQVVYFEKNMPENAYNFFWGKRKTDQPDMSPLIKLNGFSIYMLKPFLV